MLSLVACLILVYLLLGALFYIWGYPWTFSRNTKADGMEGQGLDGLPCRHAAHAVQVVNFILHDIPRLRKPRQLPIAEIYEAAVTRAFDLRRLFITTGSPHSRAIYPRNYAWFYPTLLDPNTFISPDDAGRRVTLIARSLDLILGSGKDIPYPTTFIPITSRRFAAVNYEREPSDTLLGVFAGLEQLVTADARGQAPYERILGDARDKGRALLELHRPTLQFQLQHLISSLREFAAPDGATVPLIDRDDSRSSSTDTRIERRRFVANANVWATFHKAVQFGITRPQEIETVIGRSLDTYRHELLRLFGASGHIVDSLENPPNVTLDFCHVRGGFWSFTSTDEIAAFQNTADIFLDDPQLQDDSRRCFLIAATNPKISFFKRISVHSYHGRTMWPAFNVAFADRLLDLASATGKEKYRAAARSTLDQIRTYVSSIGYYPELLREDGTPYRTWIYHCARANSWFPHFASVWWKAFDEQLA